MSASPAWRLGEELTAPHYKNLPCYKQYTKASFLGWSSRTR